MKSADKKPLVTVGVITYNSSQYIVDTLNTTLGQTYPNIELVISDDCSTDNTPQLIEKWLSEHEHEFVSAKFVQTPQNMGVCGNCNNAIRNGKGEWIKLLSGDDQFMPETVEGYMDYALKHPEYQLFFGKFQFFSDNEDKYFNYIRAFYEHDFYTRIKLPLKKQKKEILKRLFIPGPGTFFSRRLYDEVGGFDERYPFCEEDPFFGRAIASGHKIEFIDRELYRYCIRYNSLGRENVVKGLSRHERDRMRYFFDERYARMRRSGLLFDGVNQYLTYKALIAEEKGQYMRAKMLTAVRRCSPYMILRYMEYVRAKRFEKECYEKLMQLISIVILNNIFINIWIQKNNIQDYLSSAL